MSPCPESGIMKDKMHQSPVDADVNATSVRLKAELESLSIRSQSRNLKARSVVVISHCTQDPSISEIAWLHYQSAISRNFNPPTLV